MQSSSSLLSETDIAYRKNAAVDSDSTWARRIQASRDNRETHASRWRENKALLVGRGGIKGFKRGEIVNLAWAAFQTMVGVIYAQNPRPVIRGKKAVFEVTAKMLTDIVVSDLEDMRARYVTRLAICDVFWAGFAVIVEKLESDTTSAFWRYTATAADKQEDIEVQVPVDQRYSLHRAHPETVLFDTVASFADLSDSMWLGLEFYPTKQDLKNDPLFRVNADMLNRMKTLTAPPAMDERPGTQNKWQNPRNPQDGAPTETDDMAQVRCIEIWDRVNREKIYMADGIDEILGREPWPVELRFNGELQFPATTLFFNENPDELYPIPEISMVAPQLKQYSTLFRQILRDTVQKWRKFVVQGDVLQKGHAAKLLSDEQNTVISVDGTKVGTGQPVRLGDIVQAIPDPHVDRDSAASLSMVKEVMHEILGAGDFAAGGLRSTRSATEAAALSDFLKTRMTTRTENMDAFFKTLITKHVLYLQETLTDERTIQTTDENGLATWQTYTKQNLQGLFAFQVVAGSSMPQNTETRRQENLAFFQQVAPIIQNAGGNLRPMIEWIAPYMSVPGYLVEETFNNHKQALQQLALLFASAHAGAKITGAQMNEAIAAAVSTGLSQADIQNVMRSSQQAAQQQSQPGGLPGANGGAGTSGAVQ